MPLLQEHLPSCRSPNFPKKPESIPERSGTKYKLPQTCGQRGKNAYTHHQKGGPPGPDSSRQGSRHPPHPEASQNCYRPPNCSTNRKRYQCPIQVPHLNTRTPNTRPPFQYDDAATAQRISARNPQRPTAGIPNEPNPHPRGYTTECIQAFHGGQPGTTGLPAPHIPTCHPKNARKSQTNGNPPDKNNPKPQQEHTFRGLWQSCD
jgi:hypothetical protein